MPTIGVKHFARIIKETQANDNDVITVVSGTRGIGKSSLVGVIINQMVPNYYTEAGFKSINVYSRQEFNDKLKSDPEESIINIDEAITSLFKREFWLREQNNIIKMLNMYRDKRHIIFLLLPHFWDLDVSVRNSLIIKFWVYVSKRGDAYIFTPQDNPFNFDVWNQKTNMELFSKGKIYQSPNYLANIQFPKMPEEYYNLYKKVKAEKRAAALLKEKEKPAVTKKDVIKAVQSWNPGVNTTKLAEVINVERQYIYDVRNKGEKAPVITVGVD